MKLVSFLKDKQERFGIAVGGGVADVGQRLSTKYPTLGVALRAGALDAITKAAAGITSADFALKDVVQLPPVTDPLKIICIGLNYKTHIAETGRDAPTDPMLFARYADSVVGNGQAMVRPKVSEKFDFEGELAIVIGKTCRHVSEAKALDVVLGFSCLNEGSIRDYQRLTSQFMAGKTFWRSGAFGPSITTRDEIANPQDLRLTTRLNGEVMQDCNTSDLLFTCQNLIAFITRICPLNPGDVIATGTTGGVGHARKPQLWMKPGDKIEVEISKIGVLANPIIDEANAA